jgi:hypothetical protein
LLDRPAEFLGGVGRFELHAEAEPTVVRVGQEFTFRIKVTGPAAWGMTEHPELTHLDRLGIGVRIGREPDQATGEPPERTFAYRLRPTRAGEAVLPPVAISAFDPAIERYVTHVTAGVPIRIMAIPQFDPATIENPGSGSRSTVALPVVWTASGLSAVLLVGSYALLVTVRRGLGRRQVQGPTAARRYAARLGRGLESAVVAPVRRQGSIPGPATSVDQTGQPTHDAARRVTDGLIHYLQLGTGRPSGALTPDEALDGVARLTNCEELARQASRLTARCDRAMYRVGNGEPETAGLLASGGELFRALGRAKSSRLTAR